MTKREERERKERRHGGENKGRKDTRKQTDGWKAERMKQEGRKGGK